MISKLANKTYCLRSLACHNHILPYSCTTPSFVNTYSGKCFCNIILKICFPWLQFFLKLWSDINQIFQRYLQRTSCVIICLSFHGIWSIIPAALGWDICMTKVHFGPWFVGFNYHHVDNNMSNIKGYNSINHLIFVFLILLFKKENPSMSDQKCICIFW